MLESDRGNVPREGSLKEPATSSCSSEYFPNALKLMDCAHYVQSPAYTAKTVTLREHEKNTMMLHFD